MRVGITTSSRFAKMFAVCCSSLAKLATEPHKVSDVVAQAAVLQIHIFKNVGNWDELEPTQQHPSKSYLSPIKLHCSQQKCCLDRIFPFGQNHFQMKKSKPWVKYVVLHPFLVLALAMRLDLSDSLSLPAIHPLIQPLANSEYSFQLD